LSTSDKNLRFHPLGYGISKGETEDDFKLLFDSLQNPPIGDNNKKVRKKILHHMERLQEEEERPSKKTKRR